MTPKQIEKRKKYFITLFIYTAILLVLGFIALRILWSFAKEYENSQIDNVINSYMAELNKTKWNSAMSDAAGNLRNSFQNRSDVEKKIKQYLEDGNISYKTSGIGEVMSYDLICKSNVIGKVSLAENLNANTRFKLYPWTVVSNEFDFSFLKNEEPFTIELPESFSLKINGKDVGSEFIVDKGIEYDVLSQYYLDYPNLPRKVKYQIPDLVGEIEISVFDADGNPFTIDESSDDMQFVSPCTDGEKTELKSFMEDGFVEAYIKFWGTKWVDETYPTLMQYVKMGSKLQQEMYIYTLDAVTWIHTNSVVVNYMDFNYALSLGGGCYVVSETVDSTAYAEYKTVNETSDVVVIVVKDSSTGEILAIDRA